MRSDEAGDLHHCLLGAVEDQGHEEEGEGQELGIEGDDEESHLASRVVLRVRVGVGQRERRKERITA